MSISQTQPYTIHDCFSTVPCGCNSSLAVRAYQGISFDPEKRGQQELNDTQADIESLFNTMAPFLTEDNKEQAFEAFTEYVRQYRSKYSAYLYAKSNCVSWMITGRSGLNVARCNKNNDREHRLHDLFISWRERAFSKMLVRVFGSYSVNGIILSDDPDALSLLRVKLERLEQRQEFYKMANKAFRAFDKTKTLQEFLESIGLDPVNDYRGIRQNLEGWDKKPFPSYKLTNNNARIKSIKQRIERLEKYKTIERKEITQNGVRIVQNPELVRLQLFFPGKPESSVIKELKRNGFHWSPSEMAWQRQDTNQAHYAAFQIVRMVGIVAGVDAEVSAEMSAEAEK